MAQLSLFWILALGALALIGLQGAFFSEESVFLTIALFALWIWSGG
ncbi:MAG: hypothetical protein V1717_01670 [Candidatus Micrarchaeota archaeon]